MMIDECLYMLKVSVQLNKKIVCRTK